MLNSSENKIQVLIVGAGPAGLMMGCQLAIQGITFRIIDKQEKRAQYSGAYLLQARTLEIWEQMGIATEAMQLGSIVKRINLVHHGKLKSRINIEQMGRGVSRFPFIFMLKQSETEKLLCNFLEKRGIHIERNTSLITFKNENGGIKAEVKNGDQTKETIYCTYLVGADGAYSKVRSLLEIPWIGTKSEVPLFVSDCKIQCQTMAPNTLSDIFHNPKNQDIVFSISKESIAGFFPLKGGSWRLDSIIHGKVKERSEIQFDRAVEDFGQRTKMDMKVYSPDWFSMFYPNTYLAEWFSKEGCFLIGDAAHVHTPIGAQGMNTGMQDAYNLAWKIAFTIKHQARSIVLDSYHGERRPVAKELIHTTDKYFNLAIENDSFSRWMRIYIIPSILTGFNKLLHVKSLQRSFFKRISETGIAYKKSPLSAGNKKIRGLCKPGERLPFLRWTDATGEKKDLHQFIENKRFVLLAFRKALKKNGPISGSDLGIIGYEDIIKVKSIPYSQHTSKIYKKLLVKRILYVLVRPDGYLALSWKSDDLMPLKEYFRYFM